MTDKKAQATTKEATAAVKEAAAGITRAIEAGDETEVTLADADAEEQMRKEATSPAARKAALAAGKKDPIAKFGDPKLSEEDAAAGQLRRSAFGGV